MNKSEADQTPQVMPSRDQRLLKTPYEQETTASWRSPVEQIAVRPMTSDALSLISLHKTFSGLELTEGGVPR